MAMCVLLESNDSLVFCPFLFISPFSLKVGSAAGNTEAANAMMQKFWDSAVAMSNVEDDEDTRRYFCLQLFIVC